MYDLYMRPRTAHHNIAGRTLKTPSLYKESVLDFICCLASQ